MIRRAALTSLIALAVVVPPAAAAEPTARVWVTTPDGALEMADRGAASRRTCSRA